MSARKTVVARTALSAWAFDALFAPAEIPVWVVCICEVSFLKLQGILPRESTVARNHCLVLIAGATQRGCSSHHALHGCNASEDASILLMDGAQPLRSRMPIERAWQRRRCRHVVDLLSAQHCTQSLHQYEVCMLDLCGALRCDDGRFPPLDQVAEIHADTR